MRSGMFERTALWSHCITLRCKSAMALSLILPACTEQTCHRFWALLLMLWKVAALTLSYVFSYWLCGSADMLGLECELPHISRCYINVHVNKQTFSQAFGHCLCIEMHMNLGARLKPITCRGSQWGSDAKSHGCTCSENTVHATQTSLNMHTDCVAETSSYADSTMHVGDVVCTTV